MAKRRQTRLLLTLSLVLGVHLILVWLLVSSAQLSLKIKSGSIQLVWIARPVSSETAPEGETTAQKARKALPHHRLDRTPAVSANAPRSADEDHAIHSALDWTEVVYFLKSLNR